MTLLVSPGKSVGGMVMITWVAWKQCWNSVWRSHVKVGGSGKIWKIRLGNAISVWEQIEKCRKKISQKIYFMFCFGSLNGSYIIASKWSIYNWTQNTWRTGKEIIVCGYFKTTAAHECWDPNPSADPDKKARHESLSRHALGFINNKKQQKIGMGLKFEQGRHCDDGICVVGRWDLVKIWDGKWE